MTVPSPFRKGSAIPPRLLVKKSDAAPSRPAYLGIHATLAVDERALHTSCFVSVVAERSAGAYRASVLFAPTHTHESVPGKAGKVQEAAARARVPRSKVSPRTSDERTCVCMRPVYSSKHLFVLF